MGCRALQALYIQTLIFGLNSCRRKKRNCTFSKRKQTLLKTRCKAPNSPAHPILAFNANIVVINGKKTLEAIIYYHNIPMQVINLLVQLARQVQDSKYRIKVYKMSHKNSLERVGEFTSSKDELIFQCSPATTY